MHNAVVRRKPAAMFQHSVFNGTFYGHALRAVVFFFCLLLWAPSLSASPASWTAELARHSSVPPLVLAVDKSRQLLLVLERKGSSSVSRIYACTTGQVMGNKEVQGDLKTPEGVYFVVQHLESGLDFAKYGNEAFTLNYPNPVDRLRRKTGYGIWLHGRGEGIAPLQTQGCVALNNNDLSVLGPRLEAGTPVVLSQQVQEPGTGAEDNLQTAALLEKRVRAWGQSWASRSASFFEFYDKEAYSFAQDESFNSFRSQKERLFKQLPWIEISIRNVRILEGPGYWVTWFHQDYKAPNLSTQGIRRLYWMKDSAGDLKIIGMEWLPGMSSGIMVADAEPASPMPDTSRSEEQADPLPEAKKEAVGLPPRPQPTSTEKDCEGGLAAEPSLAIALHKEIAAAGGQTNISELRPADSVSSSAASSSNIPAATPTPAASQTAGGLVLPPALPSQGLAGPVQDVKPTAVAAVVPPPSAPQTVASAPEKKEYTAAEAPAPIRTAESAPAVSPATAKPVSAPKEREKDDSEVPVGNPLTAGGAAIPQDAPAPKAPEKKPAAPSDAEVLKEISTAIEQWRKAWEKGDLAGYTAAYSPSAVQPPRKGLDSIKRHKQDLWSRSAPAKVRLDNISLSRQGDSVKAVMRQTYKDKQGGGDKGIKTLVFKRLGKSWRIVEETWKEIP